MKSGILPTLTLLLWLSGMIRAEKVAKFSYSKNLDELNGKVLYLPRGTVAMSEFINMGTTTSSVNVGGSPTSIMFVIDNSLSMFRLWGGPGQTRPQGFDTAGVRYSATLALIDSIYKKSPASEVGVTVFTAELYFDPKDDPLFTPVTSGLGIYKLLGGYIPLVKLNEPIKVGRYAGKTGLEMYHELLATKRYNFLAKEDPRNTYDYTNLVYLPTDKKLDPYVQRENLGNTGTTIWGAFAAVKQAMVSATNKKEFQFAIVLSDGSNECNTNLLNGPTGGLSGGTPKWYEETAPNAPTSFTVFFDPDAIIKTAENELKAFTALVQANAYSTTNPNSAMITLKAGQKPVMDYLMAQVITKYITVTSTVLPFSISFTGWQSSSTWSATTNGFQFSRLYPLIGDTTPIDFSVKYKVIKKNPATNLFDTTEQTVKAAYKAIIR